MRLRTKTTVWHVVPIAALAALAGIVEACAATRAAHEVLAPRAEAEALRPVAPGQRFGGELLEVLAPNGEGWVVRESAAELLFGRPGASRVETYVATVSYFEVPEGRETDDPEAFTAFIRDMLDADATPQRIEGLEDRLVYSGERDYACARYSATGIDVRAPGGPLPEVMYALYCRHPNKRGLGFAAVYSQRARVIDADLAAQAEAFLAGVRAPDPR